MCCHIYFFKVLCYHIDRILTHRLKKEALPLKNKLKSLLRWAGIFLLCFAVVYLTVFFGGWKLFESGDPVLIELGAALILSVFVFAFNETITKLEKKIEDLEKRIDALIDTKNRKSAEENIEADDPQDNNSSEKGEERNDE